MATRLTSVCLLFLLCIACKNRLERHGELFAEVMKTPGGLFRGLNLGDSPDVVQQEETGTPTEQNENSITYEMSIGGTGTCKITYNFENNGLYEILVEAGFEKSRDGLDLLAGFREYFNEKYGPYTEERGSLVWEIKSKGPENGIILEMTDESEFSDFGLWSLAIYKPAAQSKRTDSLMVN
ncbi:MAG: hypothetical protein IT240_05235 [Bacteroidia bacterium]|jgi:hypothetical protein|nr:hypothetical protein [Bacteroidia bacterium]MCC6768424.1 hypothetical protein [Bacteroidia bacterium]